MCHWWLTSLSTIYSYIVMFSFLGWVNRSTWRNHHRLIASHWQILSSTPCRRTMSEPVCILFFEIYKGAFNMHARRVTLSTHDTTYHNLTTLPTEKASPIRHLWTFCDIDEVSKFDHDSRNNDENVCKIPVFNNLRSIHKLWYKQHRKTIFIS